MEYSKEDLMEAKKQIWGVGENMGTEESKKIWEVVDCVGNSYKKMATVYIVDTEPKIVKPVGTTRFINEKYYYESYENGGLEENSIWKTNPEYISIIEQAFQNAKNKSPVN